jgi:hypothetical protein
MIARSPVQRVSLVYEGSLLDRYSAADRQKLAARQQGLLLHQLPGPPTPANRQSHKTSYNCFYLRALVNSASPANARRSAARIPRGCSCLCSQQRCSLEIHVIQKRHIASRSRSSSTACCCTQSYSSTASCNLLTPKPFGPITTACKSA